MVSYGYLVEYFLAWYSAEDYELYQYYVARPSAPGAALFYLMLAGNVVAPQLLWSSRIRANLLALFLLSLLVNAGMWAERFVIIVLSLQREFMVSKWETYSPTWVDLGILFGTICFFLFLFLSFLRFIPFVSSSEVKELRHELAEHGRTKGGAS
jgi:molybdopterin-containing oxidoreductase family membrane subunit